MRRVSQAIALVALTLGAGASAFDDGAANEERARQALGDKLLRIGQLNSMHESKFPESASGGKDFNSDDGNTFSADTTYHKHIWDECLEWVGGQYCNSWLTGYVSKHGFGGDFSPLEGLVAAEWKKRKGQDGGKTFEIWQIDRDGGKGGNTDVDGKLDRNNIVSWNLLPDVKRKVQNLGESYAETEIRRTYYDESAAKNTMPNPEGLRVMASRYTKMYRNNLLNNLGQLRAMDQPIEFALGEDKPNCEAYRRAMPREMEETRIEERLQPQARLQPETRAQDLDARYQMCVQIRAANYQIVNAQIRGNKVAAGNPEEEQYDKMAARVNLALMDRVGISPNSVPHPGNVAFRRSQYANDIVDHNYGGTVRGKMNMSNAEQLASYNQLLDWAAAGVEGAAARAGGAISFGGGQVQSYKIAIGSRNMIDINNLTPEMQGELANTKFAASPAMSRSGPQLEQRPSELTVRSAR
jgi:hypothetical protein